MCKSLPCDFEISVLYVDDVSTYLSVFALEKIYQILVSPHPIQTFKSIDVKCVCTSFVGIGTPKKTQKTHKIQKM